MCTRRQRRFVTPPELKAANEAETALTEPDAIQFWQAYLVCHEGPIGQGRERYEALLGRYKQGWQVAQMMYDLAVQSRQQLRLEEAVEWAGKAAQLLPKSSAVLDLRKSCEEALAADRPLAASVAELQEAVGKSHQPEAKADGLMKIAEVQFQRNRYDEGVRELRRVWEEFPGSSFAPKAMFRAAEILDRVPDRKAEARKTLEDLVLRYPTNGLSPKVFDFLKKPEGSALLDEVDRATPVPRSAATDARETPEADISRLRIGRGGIDAGGPSESSAGRDCARPPGPGRRREAERVLSACKARCDQELPTSAARILAWAQTYAGLLGARSRICSYRVVNAVKGSGRTLPRAQGEGALPSRAAMLATLSQAEQTIARKEMPREA